MFLGSEELIEKIVEGTVDVAWLDGGYKKPWKPATRREGRRVVPWKDTVSKAFSHSFFFHFDQIHMLVCKKAAKDIIMMNCVKCNHVQ